MKQIKVHGLNILAPKIVGSFVFVVVAITALVAYSFRGSMGSMNMPSISSANKSMADIEVQVSPAMKQTFVKLAAAHTDVCQDMGNKPAIDNYMKNLPSGSRLQGSCCSPMDMKKYASQVNGLKAFADIPQIPQDPYSISKDSAMQMLGYYNYIQLTPAQQATYDNAQKMTDDQGWCCCQCWAWYTHAGLAKYLIRQHNFNTEQIVKITNLEDCCGGAS